MLSYLSYLPLTPFPLHATTATGGADGDGHVGAASHSRPSAVGRALPAAGRLGWQGQGHPGDCGGAGYRALLLEVGKGWE